MRRVSLLRLWAVPLLWMWAVTRGDESAAAGEPDNADLSPDLSPDACPDITPDPQIDPSLSPYISFYLIPNQGPGLRPELSS